MTSHFTPTSLARLAFGFVAVLWGVIAVLMYRPSPILFTGILHAWLSLCILFVGIGASFGLIVEFKAIRGMAGATVQCVLYGVILGMVSGALVGVVYGSGKPFAALGIFIGGPLGALLGGILGW